MSATETRPRRREHRPPGRQSGFSMIELMVALLIGLFLLGGMSTLVQNNRRTTAAQSQLARLQDMERIGLGLLTTSIQQAGYFPDPTSNTSATWAGLSGNLGLGSAIFAVTKPLVAPYAGEWLFLRYQTANGDGILNCDGSTNTTGPAINVGFYFINNGQLTCRLSTNNESTFGGYIPLVGDAVGTPNALSVTNLGIYYGVNTSGTGQNVDTYKTSAQMTSTDWLNVISMQITLSFTNPLCVAANTGQPCTATTAGQSPTVSVTRIVSVMHQTGI